MKTWTVDQLHITQYPTRQAMGAAAAADAAAAISRAIDQKGVANVMFAAAPSQMELLDGLAASAVDWSRVNAFHMDNYIGLPLDAPQQFSTFLTRHMFSRVPMGKVFLMGNTGEDAARYAALLAAHPLDVCLMGVGENGHLAFNDPGMAFFDDPLPVKTVTLDGVCRNQQVRDGCFATLADVPLHALTATIPTLTGAAALFCVVPARSKAQAVHRMLLEPIDEACPASVLRRYASARLYLDADAAALL